MITDSLNLVLAAAQIVLLATLAVYRWRKARRPQGIPEGLSCRELLDGATIPYHVVDLNGRVSYVNTAACKLFGYNSEALVGRPVWELGTLQSGSPNEAAVRRKLSGHTVLEPFDFEIAGRNGDVRTLRVHESWVRDPQGRIKGILSAMLDITRLKNETQELIASRESFQAVAENIPVMLWTSDISGETTFVNKRWYEFTGLPHSVIGSSQYHLAVHPDDLNTLLRERETAIRDRRDYAIEMRLRRKDGAYRWVWIHGAPAYSSDGTITGFIGSVTDIHDRMTAQERLRLLESVVVNANEAVAITQPNPEHGSPEIIYANRACEELSGHSAEELIGASPLLLFGLGQNPESLTWFDRANAVPAPARLDRVLYREDGSAYWVEMDVVPLQGRDGRLTHSVIFQRDVTERRQIADELQRTVHELSCKNKALGIALEAARETTELKSRFLANVSHEIRTPLNGVMASLDLLLTTSLDLEQKEYIQVIRSSSSSLLTVMNDILDLSRIEAGRLELDETAFNLRSVLDETLSQVMFAATAKQLNLRCKVDPILPAMVHGDPGRLRQILTNLIGNAVKFSDSGQIAVRIVRQNVNADGFIRFEVEDSGIGIPDDQVACLFRRFSQADNSSRRKHGGSGLGLAIARQLIQIMGGEIGFFSKWTKGSTFWFTVPLIAVEQTQFAQPSPIQPQKVLPKYPEKRILLAEDNEVNSRIALRILNKLGYSATAVSNGSLATEAAAASFYDLILMDVQMPEMDGLEATREIRKHEGPSRHTPIVAMTANAMAGDRERCFEAGMDDYISKPVGLDQVRQMLEKWTATEESQAPVHGVVLTV